MNSNYFTVLIRKGKMHRLVIVALVIATFKCNEAKPGQRVIQASEGGYLEDAPAQQTEEDLENQILELKRNVSDLWSYVFGLRNVVSQHLTHLRQHQIDLEILHKGSNSHSHSGHSHSPSRSDDHHHDDDHHSTDDQHHSTDDHHHSDDHGSDHSHTGEKQTGGHVHEDDHSHSHSDEQHSHDHENEHHSHDHSSEHHSGDHGSGEHHSHSGSHSHDNSKEETVSSHARNHGHGHEFLSHSHAHSHGSSSHSHGSGHGSSSVSPGHEEESQHDHKDSHEKEEDTQQKQEPEPTTAPVVLPTQRSRNHHHHHHSGHHSQGEDLQKPTSDPLRLLPSLAHHHHELTSDHQRSNITTIPKYSEYNKYRFATCNMQPNRAIPEDKQQEVKGEVNFWQKKTGGPMGIHVRLEGFSVGGHEDHEFMQQQMNEAPTHEGGHRHGFHVHTNGDLSDGCQSTGPHYNPKMMNHGGPRALTRHVGDLGNIACDEHGVTNILFSDDIISLIGQYSIIGKSLVIHTSSDDYGLKQNDIESLKTGNAGTRIACCIIESIEKLPLRSHKSLKTATIHQNR